jgi:hypothetical protein
MDQCCPLCLALRGSVLSFRRTTCGRYFAVRKSLAIGSLVFILRLSLNDQQPHRTKTLSSLCRLRSWGLVFAFSVSKLLPLMLAVSCCGLLLGLNDSWCFKSQPVGWGLKHQAIARKYSCVLLVPRSLTIDAMAPIWNRSSRSKLDTMPWP